jgi:FtsP/CotA-like multicopper oxidase with cupredoxin domain
MFVVLGILEYLNSAFGYIKEKRMERRRSLMIIGLLAATASFVGGMATGWAAPVTGPGDTPDYFETPNWAFSPPLTKFVDSLPNLWDPKGGGVAPAKCIAIAVPDSTTYPGCDYYEIELRQYAETMHSELPPTTLRGYVQVNLGTDNSGNNTISPAPIRYVGPLIVATKDRPVRIKFTNALPVDSRLFLPIDTTVMGSGAFEINYDPLTNVPIDPPISGYFSENRAVIHMHGGRTAWISDGTPHQWITPKNETTTYPKGASVTNVPDMWFDANGVTIASCAGQTTCAEAGATNDPGSGSQTYYYTNQQSARMMFYHDHAWGITRLNVYAGEVAGYLITDDAEKTLLTAGTIPPDQIPLIFQDKTFVDAATIDATDPTWNWGTSPPARNTGDLWWPHVYMPAQNPYNPDMSGINAMGRWHYGPWFWPPTPLCYSAGGTDPLAVPPYCVSVAALPNPYYDENCDPATAPTGFCQPPEIPGTPSPSWGAEAFLDTPVINGAAYPTLSVDPKPYRFRVLNGSHDRFINLQFYRAVSKDGPTTPGAGTPMFLTTTNATKLSEVAMVAAAARPLCTATYTTNCTCDPTDPINGLPAGCIPDNWPADGREGGVPDPATSGPAFIQIGTEGGFLPAPVVLPNMPISYNLDPTMFNVGNVNGGTLILGPAERADVIVDFTNFAGKTLILYNDAPTAFPALDPHYDYYTGAPDRTDIGGATKVLPGVGPNIRTIMQITVSGHGGTAPVNDYNATILTNLQNAFKTNGTTPGVFAASQEPIIVGQKAYGSDGNSAYNIRFPYTWPNWGVSRISDTSISFMKPDGTLVSKFPMEPKAIHDEMGGTFDDYGRMSAKLGLEVPFSNAAISTFALQNYSDPPTEITADNQVQIWKVTHNGVDTHPIHFHLFEVQVINRVGWDGFIRLPDANELGWKDTVRMAPLEDTIVALRAIRPRVPFVVPESVRPLNPAILLGSTEGFSQIDPLTGGALPVPITNEVHNFGHEYVWHCHILSHEENDMMRPLVFNPSAITALLWRNTLTGKNRLWTIDGVASPLIQAFKPLNNPNWKIVGRGDFNRDGKIDILWRNTSTGDNQAWFMDGNRTISGQAIRAEPDLNEDIVGTGDFNGDGKVDILWRNSSTGKTTVWFMDGTMRVRVGLVPAFKNLAWTIAGTRDFNSDGKPDILTRNPSTGANMVWYMDGVNPLATGNLPPLAGQEWKLVAAGDFKRDINFHPSGSGRTQGEGAAGAFSRDMNVDLLWRNTSTGANVIWYLEGLTLIGSEPFPGYTDTNWELVGF